MFSKRLITLAPSRCDFLPNFFDSTLLVKLQSSDNRWFVHSEHDVWVVRGPFLVLGKVAN